MIILPVISNYSKEKVTIYLDGEYVTTEHAPESFFVGFTNEQCILRTSNYNNNFNYIIIIFFSLHLNIPDQHWPSER